MDPLHRIEAFIEYLKRRAADGGTSAWLEKCLHDLHSSLRSSAVVPEAGAEVSESSGEQRTLVVPSGADHRAAEETEVMGEGCTSRRRSHRVNSYLQRVSSGLWGEEGRGREDASGSSLQPSGESAHRDYQLHLPGATDEAGSSQQDPGQPAGAECGLPQAHLSGLMFQLSDLVSSL